MKKFLLIATIGLATLAMSSCKKEFKCECVGISSSTTYEKTGKGKNANDACSDAANKTLGIPTEVCVPK